MANILKNGFPEWQKKEYDIFINDVDLYGKNSLDIIAKDIPSKSFEEISNYSKVFWEIIDELPEGQRILKNMEKREKLEKQKNHSSRLISKKCENIEDNEYENIKINFPPGNHQSEYTYEDDQYLIYITNKYGYGNWDDIMRDVKTSEDLLFNYYLKSRNKAEIQKRVDYLVKLIEKELGNLMSNKNNNADDTSLSLNSKSQNNKKKKTGKKEVGIVIEEEDYEEEKNNEDNVDMVTDEDIYNEKIVDNKKTKEIQNNSNENNVIILKNKLNSGNFFQSKKDKNQMASAHVIGKKRKIKKKLK